MVVITCCRTITIAAARTGVLSQFSTNGAVAPTPLQSGRRTDAYEIGEDTHLLVFILEYLTQVDIASYLRADLGALRYSFLRLALGEFGQR